MESSSVCRNPWVNGSIFTSQEWRKRYPLSAYKGKEPHAVENTLHYLIANGQPSKNVLNYMKTPQGEGKVKKQDSKNHDLTPLALAVMTGQTELAERMLKVPEAASTVTTPDKFGWTPVHHAVLSAPHLLPVLRQKADGVKLENNMGATPEDLEGLIGRTSHPLSASRTFFKTPQGYVPFSGLRDLSTTGIEVYTDDPIFPPERWKNLWEQVSDIKSGSIKEKWGKELKIRYLEWRKNPPLLKVVPSPQLQESSNSPLGLFAAKTIRLGTVIGEYSGVVIDPEKYEDVSLEGKFDRRYREGTAYLLDSYDARNAGSAMRWANCGFPNAIAECFHAFGVQRYALIAMETIKPGEEVLLNYGISQVELVFGTQKLLGRERMEAFFQKGLEPLVQQFSELFEAKELPILCFWEYLTKILFPLDNPMALLYLHFKNLVNASKWFQAIRLDSSNPLFLDWMNQHGDLSWVVRSVLMRILDFEKELEHLQELKEAISQWILARIESLSVMQILKGLDLIRLAVSSGKLSMENWRQYGCQLGEQLSSYNWIEDGEGPMSFERRYQDFKEVCFSLNLDKKTLITHLKEDFEPFKQFVNLDSAKMIRRYLQELEADN